MTGVAEREMVVGLEELIGDGAVTREEQDCWSVRVA
jgi:hypothetical protein